MSNSIIYIMYNHVMVIDSLNIIIIKKNNTKYYNIKIKKINYLSIKFNNVPIVNTNRTQIK